MLSHDADEFAESDIADYMDRATIALSITSCSLLDHPLIHVNEAFCRLSGYAPDEVVGRNCRFMQREYREQDSRFRIRQFIRGDAADHLRCPIVNFRADGSPFVNLVYLSKIRTPDRSMCFIFASQFDVTDKHRDQLKHYDSELRDVAGGMSRMVDEHGLMLDHSISAIANASAAIAESKLALRSIEQTG